MHPCVILHREICGKARMGLAEFIIRCMVCLSLMKGRRRVALLGFLALPIRGILFAMINSIGMFIVATL